MTISAQQLKAMENLMSQEYVRRLTAFYRDGAPAFCHRFSDAQLSERVREAIPHARGRGLHSAEAIVQYIGLALMAGPGFYDDPRVNAFLSMPGAPTERKLTRLVQLVYRKLAAAAEQR